MSKKKKKPDHSYQVGINAERYVKDLINIYKNFPSFIYNKATLTDRNSFADRLGVDVYISTEFGTVPLQVKNSQCSSKNRKYYSERGIGLVTLRGRNGKNKTDQQIIDNVLRDVVEILIDRGDL